MAILVKKFGGSSVSNNERIQAVAKICAADHQKGHQVIVVVSAQGDTTDEMLEKAMGLHPGASKREMDMLLSCGEQMSAALLAIALEHLGQPVTSLTGWQAGMQTNSDHRNARILKVDADRVRTEMQRNQIVVIAGFQGINRFGDITTLGRGASDTTAVAFAAVLGADVCQIYTDVDGVYTADPRIVADAQKLNEITYDEMLELASLGAQVLHNRSVEMAKRFRVPMEVLSSFSGQIGTAVKEVVKVENKQVSGVARDNNVARLALIGLQDEPGVAGRIFSLMAHNKINVDIILQSIGRHQTKDISFTIQKENLDLARTVLEEHREQLRFEQLVVSDKVSKVSAVGAGMVNNPGVAAQMFEALAGAGINIQMISTSEIKVSVLIDLADSDRAVQVIHKQFFH